MRGYGLLRALGALRRQVLALFLLESAFVSALGGLLGLAAGIGGALGLHWVVPALPVRIAWPFVGMALAASVLIGLVSGVGPALKAARLDPVEALREE